MPLTIQQPVPCGNETCPPEGVKMLLKYYIKLYSGMVQIVRNYTKILEE